MSCACEGSEISNFRTVGLFSQRRNVHKSVSSHIKEQLDKLTSRLHWDVPVSIWQPYRGPPVTLILYIQIAYTSACCQQCWQREEINTSTTATPTSTLEVSSLCTSFVNWCHTMSGLLCSTQLPSFVKLESGVGLVFFVCFLIHEEAQTPSVFRCAVEEPCFCNVPACTAARGGCAHGGKKASA